MKKIFSKKDVESLKDFINSQNFIITKIRKQTSFKNSTSSTELGSIITLTSLDTYESHDVKCDKPSHQLNLELKSKVELLNPQFYLYPRNVGGQIYIDFTIKADNITPYNELMENVL